MPHNPQPATDNLSYHTPVLLDEVGEGLQVKAGEWYVDATVGGGGHSLAILQAGGKVLGIDQDQDALNEASRRLMAGGFVVVSKGAEASLSPASGSPQNPTPATRNPQPDIVLVKGNFRDIASIVSEADIGPVAGVLMDLGVSSYQLDAVERGFSFNSGTLDMRMDASQPVSAADLVATLPERDLAQLLFDLGEERLARRFAQAIVQARQTEPITSGQRLADIIRAASPVSYRHGPIHPATRTFQALRLAVNDELGSLALALPQVVSVLAARGRLAVISFHSLEDRLVKRFIQQDNSVSAITKQPIMATDVEIATNPRSRSAKLRIAEKIAHE